MTAPEIPRASGRPTCFVCFKPRATCVCSSIARVDNRTLVSVLQHPRERAHPIGTARFVDLGLSRSEVVQASGAARDFRRPMALLPGAGLLFPREDARDLAQLPEHERPPQLVVLDGTWPQARTLYRQNEWLHALPHYRLSPSAPSRYRIRKEPSPDYVSTIESVLLALRILEPEVDGLDGLLAAFDAMIDDQIRRAGRAKAAGQGKRRKHWQQSRRFRGVPRWLGDGYEALVGVYAEALPIDDDAPPQERQLVQLAATPFGPGERFERMVMPRAGLPTDDALAPLGLCREDFGSAVSIEELVSDFARFVTQGRVCVAWNGSTPSLLHDATGLSPRVRLLRPVVRGLDKLGLSPFGDEGQSFSLDQWVARVSEGAPLTELPFRGRAGLRLANLGAVAAWTRARASVSPEEV